MEEPSRGSTEKRFGYRRRGIPVTREPHGTDSNPRLVEDFRDLATRDLLKKARNGMLRGQYGGQVLAKCGASAKLSSAMSEMENTMPFRSVSVLNVKEHSSLIVWTYSVLGTFQGLEAWKDNKSQKRVSRMK